MQTITASAIAQLYDPYVGHSEDATPYTPNPNDIPTGALHAALEFFGLHGYIISPLYAVPSPTLCELPEVVAIAPLKTLKLQEQTDGSWTLILSGMDLHDRALFTLEASEMAALLARDNLILHGKPSPEMLAADSTSMPPSRDNDTSDTTDDAKAELAPTPKHTVLES